MISDQELIDVWRASTPHDPDWLVAAIEEHMDVDAADPCCEMLTTAAVRALGLIRQYAGWLAAERNASARLARRTRTIPTAIKRAVRARDGDRCRYCGAQVAPGAGLSFDHYDPDGPATLANIVIACRSCNTRKGAIKPRSLWKRRRMRLRPVIQSPHDADDARQAMHDAALPQHAAMPDARP